MQESKEDIRSVKDESIEAQGQKAMTIEDNISIEPFEDKQESTMVIRPPVINSNIATIGK